jgi:DNA-binding transcriptional MerR regulator
MKDLPDKLYYRTNELANAFDVNASLIRFWEKEFSFILKPKKNAKGERLYTSKDVNTFKLIYQLVKENGYTLEGAKKKIRSGRQKINKNMSVIDRLEKVKKELKEIRDNL